MTNTRTYNTVEITSLVVDGEELIRDGVELGGVDWESARLVRPDGRGGGMVVSVRFNRGEAEQLFAACGDEKVSTYIKRKALARENPASGRN